LIEISSPSGKLLYYQRRENRSGEVIFAGPGKGEFFLSPRRENDAPTVSNTPPPAGNNPIGVKYSIRNATTPILENIALRQM